MGGSWIQAFLLRNCVLEYWHPHVFKLQQWEMWEGVRCWTVSISTPFPSVGGIFLYLLCICVAE